jgi:GntR family transcriptional repressor for pyruvate dehydrogenase complex
MSADDLTQLQEVVEKFTYLEVVEARKIIEGEIAVLAARNATSKDFTNIRECLNKMELMAEVESAFLLADYSFHMAIADASGNRVLKEMLKTTRSRLMEINLMVVKAPNQIEAVKAIHKKILDSLIARDEVLAKSYMIEHLGLVGEAVNKTYK